MGYTLFLGSLLDNNALYKKADGFSVDFQKAFIAIDELSHVFEYYLSLASRDDAQEFIERVHPEHVLKQFKPYLPKN